MEKASARAKVSIVIPTHNRHERLHRTLSAVLAQTYSPIEVVIVDDGCDEPVSAPSAPVVRVVRNDIPQGVAEARNRGTLEATGEFVAFLDDDDLWAPDKLQRQLAAMNDSGLPWCCAGSVAVDDDLRVLSGGPTGPINVREIRRRNVVPAGASSVVVRTDLLPDPPFDPRLRHMADWDLWLRLADASPPAVVDEPLVAYVQHDDNASLDAESIATELDQIERRHAREVDRAYVYRWIAWGFLRRGERSKAAGWYLRAILTGDLLSVMRLGVATGGTQALIDRRVAADPGWAAKAASWLETIGHVDADRLDDLMVEPLRLRKREPGRLPKVLVDTSVVIPTLGRPLLRSTLCGIANGTAWPQRLVVSQQGDKPGPALWCDELRELGLDVIHIVRDERGVARSANRGLAVVETPLVLMTHDDCVPAPDWVAAMSSALAEYPDRVVIGQVVAADGGHVPSTLVFEQSFEVHRPSLRRDFLFPNNLGMPTSVIERVGLFDEDPRISVAEDCDYSYRILSAGIPIRFDPRPVVTHAAWRQDDALRQTYRAYARSLGSLYGMWVRRGDLHMLIRMTVETVRIPWLILRGLGTRNRMLLVVARGLAEQLVPGFLAGLRRRHTVT